MALTIPATDPEFQPLENAGRFQNPAKSRRSSWRSPFVAVLFLIPFLFMLLLHPLLNLSDAFLGATEPGRREAHDFNLLMVVAFYLGIGAALNHLASETARRAAWVIAKPLILAILVLLGILSL